MENRKSKRKKGDRPVLSSSTKDDPKLLEKKLKEKEIQAALNRQKEKEKLAAKIAAQEERARLVLERKKLLQDSNQEERLSVGGENDSSQSSQSASDQSSTRDSVSHQSCSDSNASSRNSQSLDTETTDVDDRDESSTSLESSPIIIKKDFRNKTQERVETRVK